MPQDQGHPGAHAADRPWPPRSAQQPAPPSSVAAVQPATPILRYADAQTGQLVLIARFASHSEANMAAGRLETARIECTLSGASSGPAMTYFGMGDRAATLGVPREDVERAVAILLLTPARRCLVDPWAQPAGTPAGAGVPAADLCPQCRSPRSRRMIRWWGVAVIALLLSWLPLLGGGWIGMLTFFLLFAGLWWANGPLKCLACGHTWRPQANADGETADDEEDDDPDPDDEAERDDGPADAGPA